MKRKFWSCFQGFFDNFWTRVRFLWFQALEKVSDEIWNNCSSWVFMHLIHWDSWGVKVPVWLVIILISLRAVIEQREMSFRFSSLIHTDLLTLLIDKATKRYILSCMALGPGCVPQFCQGGFNILLQLPLFASQQYACLPINVSESD